MGFLKKHYEKILLSLVLLGLVGALVFMALIIPNQQEKVKEIGQRIIEGKVAALTNLDLMRESNVVERLLSPYRLDFDTTNRLFNPMEWKKMPDGTMVPGAGLSPQAAVVTSISPLYLVLTLESVDKNEPGGRYVIGVERQAAASPAMQRKQSRYVSMDDAKKDVFTLIQVKGPPENPDALVLQLADTGQRITLTNGTPFRRVDAYAADIRYDPDRASWSGQRIGRRLRFAGDDYTIVDINSHEVVLLAQSNQKKWILPYVP